MKIPQRAVIYMPSKKRWNELAAASRAKQKANKPEKTPVIKRICDDALAVHRVRSESVKQPERPAADRPDRWDHTKLPPQKPALNPPPQKSGGK